MLNNFLCLLLSVVLLAVWLAHKGFVLVKWSVKLCGSCTFKFIDYKWNPITDKMIEEKRYTYQPGKHFCLIACVTAWYLSSFFIYLWTKVLPLGLLMLRLLFFHGELKLHLWFIAGDNTFFDVFRDFSNMASKEPDRLKRKFDSKDPNRQTPVWFDMIKI